jgi:C4-dicarboxylate transporter
MPLNLGSLAWLGGELGKLLSPIAPVVLVLADFAKIKPIALIRFAFIPISVAVFICFFWFM